MALIEVTAPETWEFVLALILAASEVEARSVCAFTADVMPEVCAFVLALTDAVPAVMLAARLEEAARMLPFVVVTFVAIPPSVEPSELEALSTFVFVVLSLVPSAARVEPSDDEAFVTSAWRANEPEERDALVRLRIL